MNGLVAIAESLLISYLLHGKNPISAHNSLIRYGVGFAGLLTVAGLGFILYGLHLWFNAHYSADMAFIMTGGTFVAAALLVTAPILGFLFYEKHKLNQTKEQISQILNEVLEMGEAELETIAEEHPYAGLAASAMAGYATGNIISLK